MWRFKMKWRASAPTTALLVPAMAAMVAMGGFGCPGPATVTERPRSRPEAERPTPRADPLKVLAARAAQGQDRRERLAAVRGLAKMSTRAAAEAMIEAVDGESLWLRPAVADALVTMPPKVLAGLEVAIEVLVAELRPAQKARFRRLAHGLAAIGDPAVVALLRAMPGLSTNPGKAPPAPKSTAAEVARARAAKEALVLLGDRIVPTLVRLARDGLRGTIRFALDLALVEILGSMGPAVLPQLVAHFGKGGRLGTLAEDAMKRMGAAAAPALVKLLGKPGQTAALRSKLVAMLGLRGDKGAVTALLQLLKRRSLKLRKVAIQTLGELRVDKTFKILARLARRGKKELRLAAIAALGTFGTKPAKKLLGRLKRSRNKAIAKAAAKALTSSFAIPGGKLGIPKCDAYLGAMYCYLNLLPAAARGPALAAFNKAISAWRKMASGPARNSIAKTCGMALAAWRKGIQSVPRYRRCLKP